MNLRARVIAWREAQGLPAPCIANPEDVDVPGPVSAAGGADSGTKTSRVVFRNSSNVLGYVSATESTDVLDGILGYKNSDGALKFSTVIDGGTY